MVSRSEIVVERIQRYKVNKQGTLSYCESGQVVLFSDHVRHVENMQKQIDELKRRLAREHDDRINDIARSFQ